MDANHNHQGDLKWQKKNVETAMALARQIVPWNMEDVVLITVLHVVGRRKLSARTAMALVKLTVKSSEGFYQTNGGIQM